MGAGAATSTPRAGAGAAAVLGLLALHGLPPAAVPGKPPVASLCTSAAERTMKTSLPCSPTAALSMHGKMAVSGLL